MLQPVSEEVWYEVFERALLRIEKMSYPEFEQRVFRNDIQLLAEIQSRVAEAMTEQFINEGEW